MSQQAFGAHFPPDEIPVNERIDIEVHTGTHWLSLNDHYNYILGAKTLDTSTQSQRNHSATSPLYDGEFVVHSTLGNVTETIEVYVLGNDQVTVGDNLARLMDAFRQSMYNVRRTFGTDVEVWTCWPSEYSIQRGHVNIHNKRATIAFSVPRLPKVSREVIA
jgi:hypothetical protein